MEHRKYDWNKIQKEYDSGKSWRDLQKIYKFCWNVLTNAKRKGKIKSRTIKEGLLVFNKSHTRLKHTQECKDRLSKIRIKFLEANPDKVPYLLNHYSKGDSYPEKYFKELFKIENINLKHHHRIGLYQLDFYNLENKIDVEIDGDQHYLDKRIIASDIRRTKFLEENGWTVFRVKWSDYQKLTFNEKKIIVDQIKKLIK